MDELRPWHQVHSGPGSAFADAPAGGEVLHRSVGVAGVRMTSKRAGGALEGPGGQEIGRRQHDDVLPARLSESFVDGRDESSVEVQLRLCRIFDDGHSVGVGNGQQLCHGCQLPVEVNWDDGGNGRPLPPQPTDPGHQLSVFTGGRLIWENGVLQLRERIGRRGRHGGVLATPVQRLAARLSSQSWTREAQASPDRRSASPQATSTATRQSTNAAYTSCRSSVRMG